MSKLKQVDIPDFSYVPRWLVIQAEVDMRLYILEKMLEDDKMKPPINKMIDTATGYDKQLVTEAQDLIAECRWLKKEFKKEMS